MLRQLGDMAKTFRHQRWEIMWLKYIYSPVLTQWGAVEFRDFLPCELFFEDAFFQ